MLLGTVVTWIALLAGGEGLPWDRLAPSIALVSTIDDSMQGDAMLPPADVSPVATPEDEIWLISTRCLPGGVCDPACAAQQLRYWVRTPCSGWISASAEEFHAGTCAFSSTTVFLHGNRSKECDAVGYGMSLYRSLRCRTCCGVRMRFVIWSWPSDPIPCGVRVFRDARVKYRRTEPQARIFAEWLDCVGSQTKLNLVGYSYGARIVLGALHLIGGGCIDGQGMCHRNGCFIPANVALWAAATENNGLLNRRAFGCATRVIDCGLITLNRKDPVLRRYRRVVYSTWRGALGRTGIRGWGAACVLQGFEQLDVSQVIGRRHTIKRYLCADCVLDATAAVFH